MGIIEMIRRSWSARMRLLNRLADTAANAEMLAANLNRHTEMCGYPTLRANLAQLALAETAQANRFRQLMLKNGVPPKLVGMPPHEGASNWERLRNDLALQIKILRSLNSQFSEWMSIDPEMAEWLRQAANGQERRVEQLRDLTLRCDPHAFD